MYKQDQFHLWEKLSVSQQQQITSLIENSTEDFRHENAIEKCGGGTIGDYYRIQLEYLMLNVLNVLNVANNNPITLNLKNVDYENEMITFSTNRKVDINMSFQYIKDIHRYINHEWKWNTII